MLLTGPEGATGTGAGWYHLRVTQLLHEVFERIQELPDAEQDAIAAALNEDLEARFDALIASRPDVLRELARAARAEDDAALTAPLTKDDFDL